MRNGSHGSPSGVVMPVAIDPKMPFFHRHGDHLSATKAAQCPWMPNSLHGRVIIGLLGTEIEHLHGDPVGDWIGWGSICGLTATIKPMGTPRR
jgi:hypothetical protein